MRSRASSTAPLRSRVPRPAALRDRDRGRHGGRDSESAGTRDDEHGQSGEAAAGPIAADEAPRERARDGDQRHARNESRHETVGRDLHRSAAASRLPGPAIHAAHESLRFSRRLEHQRAVDGDRSRKDRVARADQPGRRLAGERRLGDVGGALDHAAVDRDFFSGAHAHPLAAANLVRGNLPLARLPRARGPADARSRRRGRGSPSLSPGRARPDTARARRRRAPSCRSRSRGDAPLARSPRPKRRSRRARPERSAFRGRCDRRAPPDRAARSMGMPSSR